MVLVWFVVLSPPNSFHGSLLGFGIFIYSFGFSAVFPHFSWSAAHKVEYRIPDETFLVWVIENDFVMCAASYVPLYIESVKKKKRGHNVGLFPFVMIQQTYSCCLSSRPARISFMFCGFHYGWLLEDFAKVRSHKAGVHRSRRLFSKMPVLHVNPQSLLAFLQFHFAPV